MSWKKLTIDDLRLVLSEDEIQKLSNSSTELEDRITKQLEIVSNMFRGAWKAKGYKIDVRDYYVAPEYITYILNYCRWQIWTTFPMAENYSLSEPRKVGYDEAVEILKDPYIKPSDPYDPSDPDNPNTDSKQDSSITLPYLRMDDPYFGFSGNFQNTFGTI